MDGTHLLVGKFGKYKKRRKIREENVGNHKNLINSASKLALGIRQ